MYFLLFTVCQSGWTGGQHSRIVFFFVCCFRSIIFQRRSNDQIRKPLSLLKTTWHKARRTQRVLILRLSLCWTFLFVYLSSSLLLLFVGQFLLAPKLLSLWRTGRATNSTYILKINGKTSFFVFVCVRACLIESEAINFY